MYFFLVCFVTFYCGFSGVYVIENSSFLVTWVVAVNWVLSFGIRAGRSREMVNTRMEGTVVNLEKKFGTMKSDMETLKMWMMEVRDTLTRMENHGKNVEEDPQGENSGMMAWGTARTSNSQCTEKDSTRFRELEIPLFTGEDSVGWLFKMERYFSINSVTEEEKLEAAVVCLERKVLNWYHWLEVLSLVKTWVAFKRQVLNRLQHSQANDAYKMLLALKQDDTITENTKRCSKLSLRLSLKLQMKC